MSELRVWRAAGAKTGNDAGTGEGGVPKCERELAQLVSLLQPETQWPRLVTIVGRADTGKTWMATRAANALNRGYGGAVYRVGLDQMTDPAQLPLRLLAAIRSQNGGVRWASASTAIGATHAGPLRPEPECHSGEAANGLERVIQILPPRPCLIVLDGFEQLLLDGHAPYAGRALNLPDGAGIVGTLLGAAPQLKCLVTSRRLLDLEGEYELPRFSPVPVNPLDAKPRSLYTRFYG